MELVRYAESEYQAWFNSNEMIPPTIHEHSSDQSQAISLGIICLINGSWTSTSKLGGSGWAWMDSLGKAQLMGIRNYTQRESPLHTEVEALRWAMESML